MSQIPHCVPGNSIPMDVEGVPCFVHVTHYSKVKPNRNADNPSDYEGYTEIEYDIYNRKGKKVAYFTTRLKKTKQHTDFEKDVEEVHSERMYQHWMENESNGYDHI